MAKNKIALEINLHQNKNTKSMAHNKWYGRVVRKETLSTRGLCQHIESHGSIYTSDVVAGVIAALRRCIPELIAQGVAVQLDGLGTFYPSLESAGADKPENYSTNEHVKGVHVRFLPDSTSLDNITSRTMKEKCSLRIKNIVNVTTLNNGKKVSTETPYGEYTSSQTTSPQTTSPQTTSPQPSPNGEGAGQTGNENGNQGGNQNQGGNENQGGNTNPPSGGGNEND